MSTASLVQARGLGFGWPGHRLFHDPAACRAWGVESETQAHSPAMGQESGVLEERRSQKWTAAAGLQPTTPKPDRLLGFDIPPGVSLITGEDGSGKTTLLRLLAGELAAEVGTLSVQGVRFDESRERYRQRVFWIDPQTPAHDALSAAAFLENLPRQHPRFSRETLADLVDGFALTPHLHKPLYMLSTGSKRKVWLSAAFAAGAPVTLIDQPFAALGGPSMRLVGELLQEAAEHPDRAWVMADHQAPPGVPLASVIKL